MSLRGKAAIAGVHDLKPERARPDRDAPSLLAEAAFGALRDAGLRKEDIDGLLIEPSPSEPSGGYVAKMAEYMGLQPTFTAGMGTQGAAGVTGAVLAASIVASGLANYVLVATSEARDPNARPAARGAPVPDPFAGEWSLPYGPAGANGFYAMAAQRYEHLYGGHVRKRAKIAVDQRTNAQYHPDAIFHGTPITVNDVENSRIVASPLHLLECVMPTCGASAFIVTSAERARSLPNPPVYILGGASHAPRATYHHMSDFLVPPVERAAKQAFAMAGYGPQDMDVLELYDSYTITVLTTLEASGFAPMGEGADWLQDQDFTINGNLPLNTHGGQMSYGQSTFAGGFSHVTEGVWQARGMAGDRQVANDVGLVYVTGSGGFFSMQSAMVMTNDQDA